MKFRIKEHTTRGRSKVTGKRWKFLWYKPQVRRGLFWYSIGEWWHGYSTIDGISMYRKSTIVIVPRDGCETREAAESIISQAQGQDSVRCFTQILSAGEPWELSQYKF